MPQTQFPWTQVSVRCGSQAAHTKPFAPHAMKFVVDAMHWLPAQQPLEQLAALHVHAPPSQYWPLAQAAPAPQPHCPASQTFAWFGSQAIHTPASPPQCAIEGALQVEPEQHPLLHESGLQPSHAPPSQCCPAGQAPHAIPAAPH
jgi:hypothetical protein